MSALAVVMLVVVVVMSGLLMFQVMRMRSEWANPKAGDRKRKRWMRRMMQLAGLWELTIAALLVMLAVQEDGWHWTTVPTQISLIVIGLAFLLIPWRRVPGYADEPGDLPDFSDHKDVERWIAERSD